MISSSLERLREERAREAINQARKSGTGAACPCCGAFMHTETSQGRIFVYCHDCLFTTSSDRCEGLET